MRAHEDQTTAAAGADSGSERPSVEGTTFAALYEQHLDQVFHYLLTYTDNSEDAADLTQHVFLRALEALPSYEDRGLPVAAWLLRIARNAAIDAYRRKRRTLPWDHLPDEVIPFAGPGPEALAVRRDALNQLRLLIAGLDAEKQDILALRFAADLTIREIAVVLGKSEAAVKKQLTRTIRKLKEQYRED
jgi:RNA polymerase sigma-70 factor (ECF subfamily)